MWSMLHAKSISSNACENYRSRIPKLLPELRREDGGRTMNTILAFIIGLFIGGSFGTAIIALLIASRDD